MNESTRRNWMKRSVAGLGWGLLESDRVRAAAQRKLRITRTEAFGLRIPFHECVRENMLENYRRENIERPAHFPWIVKIHRDEGLIGLGESA
jgi:hypothetical protein